MLLYKTIFKNLIIVLEYSGFHVVLALGVQQNDSADTNMYKCVLVIQLCLTVCDPMGYSLSVSSFHGVLQARILEWIAIPFSRASF